MLCALSHNAFKPTPIITRVEASELSCDVPQRQPDEFLRHNDRIFIRHPPELPIQYRRARENKIHPSSWGKTVYVGLSFKGDEPERLGTILDVTVNTYDEDYLFQGQVVWVHPQEHHYELGLCFNNEGDAFRARMIEQICYIEIYRRRLSERERRTISIEYAAKEWIEKFSAQFPKLIQNEAEMR